LGEKHSESGRELPLSAEEKLMTFLRSLVCALALLVFGATAQAAPVRQDLALKSTGSQIVLAKAGDKKKAVKKKPAKKKKAAKKKGKKKKVAKKKPAKK
jgi:hypothetical protein